MESCLRKGFEFLDTWGTQAAVRKYTMGEMKLQQEKKKKKKHADFYFKHTFIVTFYYVFVHLLNQKVQETILLPEMGEYFQLMVILKIHVQLCF